MVIIWQDGGNFSRRYVTLLTPTLGQWDESLVEQIFWHVDVARILAIPLPTNGMKNFLAWNLKMVVFLSGRHIMQFGIINMVASSGVLMELDISLLIQLGKECGEWVAQ